MSSFSSLKDIRQLVREADNLQRLGTIRLKVKVHTNMKKKNAVIIIMFLRTPLFKPKSSSQPLS